MIQYRLTRLAQQDLENIWEYTVNEWSLNQAQKYVGGLLQCFDAIADGRIKAKPIDLVRKGYQKVLFGKHYIFLKVAADNVVEIVRVLHVNMDIENRL